MPQMLLSIEPCPLSTITGRIQLEGIYLCSLIPLLESKMRGSVCKSIGMSSSCTMALRFSGGWLQLNAKPDGSGLWWSDSASTAAPDSPSWEHHIRGAAVEKVKQQGADRVLEIDFSRKTAYDAGGVTLIFEATGRNANIILVRRSDGRILAALRKVLSSVSRYRTISPGAKYIRPPSSGYHPSRWDKPEVQDLLRQNVTPSVLYRNLEGVGPDSARAILADSPNPAKTVAEIGRRIAAGEFLHWKTEYGSMPCRTGRGEEIQNPLDPPLTSDPGMEDVEYRPSSSELSSRLAKGISRETKKIRSAELSLSALSSPDDLRLRGNLLLTWKNSLKKGMKEAILQDWSGDNIRIDLKESLNPVENAERYFRKAGRVHIEKERLQEKIREAEKRISELRKSLEEVPELTDEQASELLQKLKKPQRKETGGPFEYILQDGWRCLAGRNAIQNDRLTFRIAGRDDIWLHARGVTGAAWSRPQT